VDSAVDVRADQKAEQLLYPESILVRGLDGVEELPAELLDVVLLEGLRLVPLEALEQVLGEAALPLGLQVHEELLQLEGNTVLFGDLLGVMAGWGYLYT
jgi:hypothetical protein